MSEVQRFLPTDQDVLISLFYRIGHWMSNIDDTDMDEKSEKAEESQVFRVLTKFSQSKNVGALCAELAEESLRQKGNWFRWAGQDDTVISDVARSKKILHAQATHEEFVLFGKSLVTIATSVARAYREASDSDVEEIGFLGWLNDKASKASLALADREAHKDLNISPAEDSALTELIETLKA